jgi:hypothetical protein
MTPRKSKGGFIYRPDNDKAPSAGSGTPTMSSLSPSTSAPASDALNLIQLTTATNEIDTIMCPATPILSASTTNPEFNGIFAGFVDKFNETQTSANPEYACAIKLLREQDGVGLSAQERMDISSFLGRNPKDVTLYVNSDAEVRALWLQQTLSKLNAANESGR